MANSTIFRKGTETFRPRARLVSVLGEQLIRDATVGLLELVKNGYDADANTVTVKLLNLANPVETMIIVEDDGNGMDLDTILYKWLEPATGHKEAAKEKAQRSSKGRLPLGEKGVGRFAAHKLGRHLTLISRARDEKGNLSDREVVVRVDWDKFEADTYLSEVGVDYEEREPQHFIKGSGTLMEMRHARTSWKEMDIARVSRALRRLMSPIRTPASFTVILKCPDYEKYEDLNPGELLQSAHAQMTVAVDENGVADYDYKFTLPPYPSRQVGLQGVDLRRKIKNWRPVERKSACGEFFVTLYIWDRSPDSIKLSGTNLADLNQVYGVSVFRDGIRVMPYGELDDDWLHTDQARYMRTSEAFERKNVIGAVEIDQISNKDLRDKSNREGFIENQAFTDLYELMRAVMNIAFNEFSEDRKKIREGEKAAKKELTPTVTHLETSVNSVTQALDETRKITRDFVEQGKITPEVASQMLATFNQTSQILETAVIETKEATTDTLTTFNEEREMLLALAGLGLAAERFTHEFARLTREASDLLREVKRLPQIQASSEATNRINTLRVTLEALQDLVLALGPMFYVRHKTREKELNVKTIISHALLLNQGQIKDNKIQTEIDEQGELIVIMREGALTQVFNNLIDNACYWLSRKSQENDRRLRVTILASERSVIVADNGPGVQPNIRHRIFDIFFSTKTDGRGLGLFISRETLSEAKATIELLEPGSHPATFRIGAAFKIQFSN
ncbi:MAG: ATP-binding protein [Anaerolineae bacterium]|nr:ATP-binding protein [Anaerolineae bacterium]